jgi:hypothetical protein
MTDDLIRRFRESATRLPEPVALNPAPRPTEGQLALIIPTERTPA